MRSSQQIKGKKNGKIKEHQGSDTDFTNLQTYITTKTTKNDKGLTSVQPATW